MGPWVRPAMRMNSLKSRSLQINRRKYLNDLLPKLPSWPINDVAALSPLNWKSSG